MQKLKLVLFITFLFCLNVMIIITAFIAHQNMFSKEIAYGNDLIQTFPYMQYSLEEGTYKVNEIDEVCVAKRQDISVLQRTSYDVFISEINRTTRIKDQIIIPNEYGIAEENIAITLYNNWFEIDDGIVISVKELQSLNDCNPID